MTLGFYGKWDDPTVVAFLIRQKVPQPIRDMCRMINLIIASVPGSTVSIAAISVWDDCHSINVASIPISVKCF